MDMQSEGMEVSLSGSSGPERAKRILKQVFRDYGGGLAVRLWDGDTLRLGRGLPAATLVFHHPRALRELILFRDPLRLAEAHFQGLVSVEGSIYDILNLKHHFHSLSLAASEKLSILASALMLGSGPRSGEGEAEVQKWSTPLSAWFARRNTKELNRKAIAFHYDVSNDFYRLWLDERMVYSCAYFNHAGESLEQAQENKLEHICRKLRLKPGERLLDIGCGWGALLRWAAANHGVRAHGVTLSRRQYEHNLAKIREDGLEGWVSVELRDYRDLEGEAVFDKVVSVGMFEHVGLKNLPVYFATAHRLLKPGGLFLNHGITHDEEGWHKTVSTRFINRYVFPDGELDTVSNVQRETERAGFEIHDVEGLRPHYALTLRQWVRRLEEREEEARQHVSEAAYRVWRLYMAACALQFEEGDVGVYQILASKRCMGLNPVPLTRQDIYAA